MFNKSKQHLKDSDCNYLEHLRFALYAALLLLVAAIASLIHAFIPSLFKGVSAYIVIKLYNDRLKNHPNPQYQEWVSSNKNDHS